MEIDRGLKIRIAISVVLVLVLLAFFVERLSYHSVVANPREPASTRERVIEACDDPSCLENPQNHEDTESDLKSSDGALIPAHTNTSGA
jgi:hypothetical protein